ncbi:MAG: response regulator [Proteobacteria bacterium]|nr:response regulator [Pseudomonadota bacterium]
MLGLLIADKDAASRKQMAALLIDAGYNVIVTDSAANAIDNVLKKTAQVLLLGRELGEFNSADLVPLLKKCNRDLMIILVADNTPLPLMRKVRQEGIFYHALRPVEPEGEEEIRQVVKCAMESLTRTHYASAAYSH